MGLTVISAERNGRQADIVVEGDTIDDVRDMAAKQLAITEAVRMGLARPGISSQNPAYPASAEGDDVEAAFNRPMQPGDKFRLKYTCTEGQ